MDLEGMSEAQMDLLMEQIAHAKKQKKARRTPEPPSVPQPSPEPVPRDQTPPPLPQNSNDIRKGFTRSKHRRDSESEDLEALDNFFKEFVTSDLPDEEWLYVSPVFRHTELHKKMRVADWLRIGSEDEFDEMPDFNPARRNEYRRSPSPSPASAVSLTRYRSPPQQTAHAPGSPRGSSPLSVDILKITTTRSRYVEEMERRKSLPSPTPITPSPDPPGDPSEPSPAHSPQNDWTRMGANSPKTPLERTNSPRQTFQEPLRQYDTSRQSPSPRPSERDSPLQRAVPQGYRRSSPSPRDDRGQYSPQERVQYAPQERVQFVPPPDRGQYSPQDRGQYVPQERVQYSPQERGQYVLSNRGQYVPPDRGQYAPQERGQLIQRRELAGSPPVPYQDSRDTPPLKIPSRITTSPQIGMKPPSGFRPTQQGVGRPRTLQQPTRPGFQAPNRSRMKPPT